MNYLEIVQSSITNLKSVQDSFFKAPRGNEVAIIEINKAIMSTIDFAIRIEEKEGK